MLYIISYSIENCNISRTISYCTVALVVHHDEGGVKTCLVEQAPSQVDVITN